MSVVRELRAKFSAYGEGMKATINTVRKDLQSIGDTSEKSIDKTNASFGDLKDSLKELDKALQKAGNVDGFDELNRTIKQSQTEISHTGEIGQKRFTQLGTAISEAKKHMSSMGEEGKSSLKQVESEIGKVESQLKKLGKDTGLDDLKQQTDGLGDSLASVGGSANLGGLGSIFIWFGKIRLAALGVIGAVAGVGMAIWGLVTQGDELLKALNSLQSQTDASSQEMQSLEQILIQIYKNNYGKDFQDIADSMAAVKQATGAAGKELYNMTTGAIILRDTFGFDVNESIRSVDILMKQFGITSDEAFNIIAQGQQKGLNKSGDMLDTFNEYSVYFKTLGFDAEGMFNIMADGAKNGVFNMDYLADAVKEFGIRVKDGSTTTVQAFETMGFNAKQMMTTFAKGGDGAKSAMLKVIESLQKIKDPVLRNNTSIALFGTKFEDLEKTAIFSLANVNKSFNKTEQTMKKIDAIKYNSVGEALQGLWRGVQANVLIPLEQSLMPGINKFANYLKNDVPGALDYLKNGFIRVWGFLSPYIMPILLMIVSFVGEQLNRLKQFWTENGSTIMQAVSNVFNFILAIIRFIAPILLFLVQGVFSNIKNIISAALNIIMGLILFFSGLFTGNWSKMWEGLKLMFSGALTFLWNLIMVMLLGRIFSVFKSFGSGVLSFISPWVKNVIQWFSNLGSGLINWLLGWKTNMSLGFQMWFREILSRIVRFGVDAGIRFLNFVDAVKGAFNKAKEQALAPINKIYDGVMDIVNKIKGAFNNLLIKIPKPKIPKVSVDMKTNSWGIPYPSFDVQWMAQGGIFSPNSPRLIGIGDASVPEAAIPLSDSVLGTIGRMIAQTMPDGNGNNNILRALVELVVNLDGREIYKVVKEIEAREKSSNRRAGGTR